MTNKLKPCPFCGSEVVQEKKHLDHINWYRAAVHCNKCHASGPILIVKYDSKDKAIAAWNKRQGENDD